MDLAEIRKKARKSPQKTSPQSTEIRNECVVPKVDQVLPESSASEVIWAECIEPRKPVDELNSKDLLDALFDAHSDFDDFFAEQDFDNHISHEGSREKTLSQWLCFSLGNEEYAIDISNIREIVKPREITDIPRVPEFIMGIISLRGIIIPIYDLKKRLHMGEALIGSDSRVIICQKDDRVVGLLVDRIAQVIRISEESVEPPPTILSGVNRAFVEGVGRSQDRMLILLCLSNVLDAELT